MSRYELEQSRDGWTVRDTKTDEVRGEWVHPVWAADICSAFNSGDERSGAEELRAALREALDGLQVAEAKLPFGERYNNAAARVTAAKKTVQTALANHKQPSKSGEGEG